MNNRRNQLPGQFQLIVSKINCRNKQSIEIGIVQGSTWQALSLPPHYGSCLAFLSREDFSCFFPRLLASNCAYVCVFTLNRSFYTSTSSIPSVRADSSSQRDTSSVVTKLRPRQLRCTRQTAVVQCQATAYIRQLPRHTEREKKRRRRMWGTRFAHSAGL